MLLLFVAINYGLYIIATKDNCPRSEKCKAITSINSNAEVKLEFQNIKTRIVVEKMLNQYSAPDLVGQMFMITISGTELNQNSIDMLQSERIGGIALLSENIVDKDQLKSFTNSINDNSEILPFIAGDQEGGTVARIKWDPAANISEYEVGENGSADFAGSIAKSHAETLIESGLNTNLGPVLDICSSENPFLETRCFSDSNNHVGTLGGIFVKEYNNLNLVSAAKHFPNHGRTNIDSHEEMPVVEINKTELMQNDVLPYVSVIKENIPMIMISHVMYPEIDSKKPASLSKIIQTDILRNELNYEGIIISDDLRMSSLDRYPNKIIDAVNAGTDIMVLTDNYEMQKEYINQLRTAVNNKQVSSERIYESFRRIASVKCKYKILKECK